MCGSHCVPASFRLQSNGSAEINRVTDRRVLMAWAHEKPVHVYAHRKDAEIGSIVVCGACGPIAGRGTVGIHGATFDGFKPDRRVPLAALANALMKRLGGHG
jgi:hypothetical protein